MGGTKHIFQQTHCHRLTDSYFCNTQSVAMFISGQKRGTIHQITNESLKQGWKTNNRQMCIHWGKNLKKHYYTTHDTVAHMNSRSWLGWRARRRLCETCSWRHSWEGSSLPAGDRTARPRALGFLRSGDTNSMANQCWDTRSTTNQCCGHKEHDQSMLWTKTAWPINAVNTKSMTNQCCEHKQPD